MLLKEPEDEAYFVLECYARLGNDMALQNFIHEYLEDDKKNWITHLQTVARRLSTFRDIEIAAESSWRKQVGSHP